MTIDRINPRTGSAEVLRFAAVLLFALATLALCGPALCQTTIFDAAKAGDLATVQTLLKGNPDLAKARTADAGFVGVTALMEAAQAGHAGCVKALVAAGADVNARRDAANNDANNSGWTVLMMAAFNGHADCIEALIAAGADVNAKKGAGGTALMSAAGQGHADCVNALIAAGADVNAKSDAGDTALMIATQAGHPDCAALLEAASSTLKPPAMALEQGLPQPIVADGLGVSIFFTHFTPRELQLFKGAGFGFIRTGLCWNVTEKRAGVYDFTAYDTLISDLKRANARALLILGPENPLYDDGLAPHTDAGRTAFANFAAAAAIHFAGKGVILEIWNEPNLEYWKPKPSVDDYGALVKATVKAIRLVNRDIPILAGATGGLPTDFIQSLLVMHALDGVTAYSCHPYRGAEPETVAQDYARVRALIAQYTPPGQPLLPIVCSEWGYNTAVHSVSEQQQAEYMLREYLTNLACGVNMTTLYDWKNNGPDPYNAEDRYGILQQDLTPKPAYTAIANFMQALHGYTFCRRLVAADPNEYKLLFEGKNDLALIYWSADPDAPADLRMPSVRKIEPSDDRYNLLLHAP